MMFSSVPTAMVIRVADREEVDVLMAIQFMFVLQEGGLTTFFIHNKIFLV